MAGGRRRRSAHYRRLSVDLRTSQLVNGVAAVFDELVGNDVVGVYPHGSIAWGDYVPESSDVDIVVVVEGALGDRSAPAAARLLEAARGSDPLAGLEVAVVTKDQAAHPSNPPTVEMEFAAFRDRSWALELTDAGPSEDSGMHLAQAIILQTGARHSGAQPADVFAPIPRSWLLDACAAELAWWAARSGIETHPVTVRTAVLNVCRARRYALDGELGSKRQGGEWALARTDTPDPEAIGSALALQAGRAASFPDEAAIRGLLAQAVRDVAAARTDQGGSS